MTKAVPQGSRGKKKALEAIHEANLRVALEERSGASARDGILLSEVTGRGGWKVEIHHILGRNKPRGFKELHPIIREFWPHIEPGCLFLTTAEHRCAGDNSKLMRPLLLGWILLKYGDRTWQGRTYQEWLLDPPFVEFLRFLPELAVA